MASFTYNTLQQQQLFSITLCKYPSTLSFKSHYFISQVLTVSTLRHTLYQEHSSVSIARATVSNSMKAKMCSGEHKQSTKTLNSTTHRDFGSGFPHLRSRDERVDRKTKVSSVVEEKTERKYRKDSYIRKDVESRKKRERGDEYSSLRSRAERVERKIKKTKLKPVVDEKMAKISKRSKGSSQIGKQNIDKKSNRSSGDIQVGEGKMDKKSKKTKVDSEEVQLRIGLDMCSKRGDALGAISLYDSAQRDGIKLGQYHYTVLLYLCSSAAVGVVLPAKSGSGSRSLNKMDSIDDGSSVNSVDVSKLEDMGNGYVDNRLDFPASSNRILVESGKTNGLNSHKMGSDSSGFLEKLVMDGNASILNYNEQFIEFPYESKKELENSLNHNKTYPNPQFSDGFITLEKGEDDSAKDREGSSNQGENKIQVSEDVKRYALMRGFKIYEEMCLEKIPLNEAALTSVARMAMSMGNGDMAFSMVKQMKELGINPRLRSYGPALFTFCNSGDVEKAFMVEEHMLQNGVYPEEPELEALLRLSVVAGRGDKVYYLLHKLRTSVRQVSPPTADLIERWFGSKAALRVGKKKWDQRLIKEAIENGGGGWHGQGWLGKGKWTVARTSIGIDGFCEGCGEKLVTIDLDPTETENFAKSVASIASKRERISSFQKFQDWLDYYGPFEAVVDAANVGLFSQRAFSLNKVNAIVNGIRQKLPSKKWPLIIVHNKRITGRRMDEPANKMLIERWKNADALYATPTGSNDDWYWLYAAIKFKCLIVTNDEMRDHIFQLLGKDFFPRWKERHQVHFSFCDGGPEFQMPPPCSVVIQESERGHWHVPIVSEHDSERERTWLCITRVVVDRQDSTTKHEEAHPHINKGRASSDVQTTRQTKLQPLNHGGGGEINQNTQNPREIYRNLRNILSTSVFSNYRTLVSEIEAAEKLGGCIIDFQI